MLLKLLDEVMLIQVKRKISKEFDPLCIAIGVHGVWDTNSVYV